MKNFLTHTSLVVAALLLPVSALAASITLAPSPITPKVGSTFSVAVWVNPLGTKTVTSSVHLSYDHNRVELVGFSFAPQWMPLSLTGYDLEDNVNGTLVKTAGYPKGITLSTMLGTATFRAKASGTSHIAVTKDSLSLDASGKNVLSGSQGTVEVIASAAIQQSTGVTTKPTAVSPLGGAGLVAGLATTAPATTTATTSLSGIAAVGGLGYLFGSTTSLLIWILLLVIIIAGGVWYSRRTQE